MLPLPVICGRLCRPVNWRLFVANHVTQRQLNLNTDWTTHAKIKRVAAMLSDFYFDNKQITSIMDSIGRYIVEEKDVNHEMMRETIECWKSNLRTPQLRPNQLDRVNAEDIDFDMSVDFNHVFSKIEPKLLLMNANAVDERVECLRHLGILSGTRDLWRVLVYAPNGYYLQSWSDFLKKFHYLNYQVLEWLLDRRDKDNLHPHPLVRNAKVMEMSFEAIQCRYLFAMKTGLKTVSVSNRLSDAKDMDKIDLKALLLTPIDKYLKLVAPNCTEEEFFALETLLSESPPEEDEQIIEDIVKLTATHNKSFKKKWSKESKDKDNDSLQKVYQIITHRE